MTSLFVLCAVVSIQAATHTDFAYAGGLDGEADMNASDCEEISDSTDEAVIEIEMEDLSEYEVEAETQEWNELTPQESTSAVIAATPRPTAKPKKKKEIRVTLQRRCGNGCTLGELTFADGSYRCKTLELPDLNNQECISCIPQGEYTCRRVKSPTFGWTYEITNVAGGRTSVLIHYGNSTADIKGCVLLGTSFNSDDNYIFQSRKAVKAFLDALNGVETFKLVIKDPPKK